jgi:hypothetical protein
MFATIVGLCTATAIFGSRSEVIEAERAAFSVEGGTTEIRPRGTLKNFNLWTGTGELLFRPEQAGDRITFSLPTEKPGSYDIALVVTRGADYGAFRAEIDGKPVNIGWREPSGEGFRVARKENGIFPPEQRAADAGHVVARVEIGGEIPSEGKILVTLIAETAASIGIDSVIITRR